MRLKPSRVHRTVPPPRRPNDPSPDHLETGRAWARIQLMRDGRVVIDGKYGAVTLDDELGQELLGYLGNIGIKEARRPL